MNNADDWHPLHHIGTIENSQEGVLLRSTSFDPYILSNDINFPATDYTAVLIEMRVSKGSQAQLFWTTAASPSTDELKSSRFQLAPDNQFHQYILSLSSHTEWKGTIQRLRFDPTDAEAEIEIRTFQVIDRIGARIEVGQFYPDRPLYAPGEETTLSLRITNSGDGAARVNLEFRNSENNNVLGTELILIEANTETKASWRYKIGQEGTGTIECVWKLDDDTKTIFERQGQLYTMAQASTLTSPEIAIRGGNSRLLVMNTGNGFGPIRLQVAEGDGSWSDMAWIPRLATVKAVMRDGTQENRSLFASEHKELSETHHQFTETWTDRDGNDWRFSFTIKMDNTRSGVFHFSSSLECENARLTHFSGPELFIGERSFGAKKDGAVLPGIEYLGRDDVSSSDAVAHPPVRDQYMPHPFKITIPFMSLTHENRMIALLWDDQHEWSKGRHHLSPKFSVPNRLYNQDNSLMGLFVPNVPDYTLENRDTAHEPFLMKAGEPVTIDCAVYVGEGNDPNDAVDLWLNLYSGGNLPEAVATPRSYLETIAVSRKAYLTTCWDENAKGWGHCAGWAPHPSGGFLTLLKLDELLCEDEAVKKELQERIKTVTDHLLDTRGPSGLGDAAGCHVMTLEAGFFWGVMEHKLGEWANRINGYRQRQNPDGSWGFHPSNDQQRNLGKDGEVTSGTIAQIASFVLRYARITANADAVATGLKALEALNVHTIPRGAQGWECPLASADILVPAYAAQANLDAYRITGKQDYLEKAVYWAKSGVVFHYLWNLETRPLQRYATIPIFGATFFTHTWIGVPVQWCGLVYAYSLLDLKDFDDSMEWETLARGIIHSAIHQQLTDGQYAGTLPDSYGDYFQTARGAFINPENIMTPLHRLEGNSLEINTAFLEEPSPTAKRLSVNATIVETDSSGNQISATIKSLPGRLSEILIAPIDHAPKAVQCNGEMLPQQTPLYGHDFGWRFIEEQKTLLIHALHTQEQVKVIIEE